MLVIYSFGSVRMSALRQSHTVRPVLIVSYVRTLIQQSKYWSDLVGWIGFGIEIRVVFVCLQCADNSKLLHRNDSARNYDTTPFDGQ